VAIDHRAPGESAKKAHIAPKLWKNP
jgi:hypothetical protein